MIDLMKAIEPKSNQLNYDDLIGGSINIRITEIKKGNEEQPVAIRYEGDNGKPYYPCKSMVRVLVHMWGPDAAKYTGRYLTLYGDPEVVFGGLKVGGIRISHMSDIAEEKTMALTSSKAKRKPFTVKPMKNTPVDIDPSVKSAGENAAKQGVDAYTEWLNSLTPEVKATVKPYHKEWSATAKAFVPPEPVIELDDMDKGETEETDLPI